MHVVSAHNLRRDSRRLTMKGNYVEVDMANAHPTLLLAKYQDSSMPIRYIRDRKSKLEEVVNAVKCIRLIAK